MNYYSFSYLLTSLAGLAGAGVVFFHNPRDKRNQTFALLNLIVALWATFCCAWQLARTETASLFLSQITSILFICIPVFQYQHTLALFSGRKRKTHSSLFWIYGITVFLIGSVFTTAFINKMRPHNEDFPFLPVPGPFAFAAFIFSFMLIIQVMQLILKFRKQESSPIIRNQLSILMALTVFGYTGIFLQIPLWYGLNIPPFLNFSMGLYLIGAGILFFRLGFFDIRLVIRESTIHAMTSLMIGCVFAALFYPLTQDQVSIFFLIVLALLLPHIYQPIYTWMKETANKTRLGAGLQYLKSIDVTMEKIRESTYTYDDLAKNIVNSILHTFPIDKAAVYFYDIPKKEFHLRAQVGLTNPYTKDLKLNKEMLSLSETNTFIEYLQEKQSVVLKENLIAESDQSEYFKVLEKTFDTLEADVAAPFLLAGKVKGFMLLGRKTGNKMFTNQDLDAITAFARMGEEIMRYIMGMEAELQHTALYSHDMNLDTKTLVQTLQSIQADFDKPNESEKVDILLKEAEDVAMRLNQTFQLNRDRSNLIMKSIKGEYEKIPTDINRIIKASISKFKYIFQKQKVSIETQLPETQSVILANPDDLNRSFDNVIANILRFIPNSGKIKIHQYEEGDVVRVEIKDNGSEIDPEEIEKIWEMGWQAKNAKEGASGFGLSIARQIIHLHGGTIRVEKNIDMPGINFKISLPLLTKASSLS